MHFIHGPGLTNVIKSILAEDCCRAAVAFWGRGCDTWVSGSGARLIANLRSGGTNPYALRSVTAALRQRDDLHAKVYIGSKRAVIGSANASVNGLALEGAEQDSWLEAGMVTDDIGEIAGWFEALWETGSRDITSVDWRDAELAWKRRAMSRPAPLTFREFDPNRADVPLLTWTASGEWEYNDVEIKRQFGLVDDNVHDRVDRGVDVSHSDDEILLKNRWILFWRRNTTGLPRLGSRLRLTRTCATIIRKGFKYDGMSNAMDVVLAAETQPAPPFDVDDPKLKAALFKILSQPKYQLFRAEEEDGVAWYQQTVPLLNAFWSDVKAVYARSVESVNG